jgi:predicted nucleotidyltransferase
MLNELIAQYYPDTPVPKGVIDWDNAASVGLEQTVRDTQVDIREAFLKFQEQLSDDVILLVLFGSRARGDYRPDRNANLAVLFCGEPGGFMRMRLGLANMAYDVLLSTGELIQSFPIWETEWFDPENSPYKDTLRNIARRITLWQI